jgi:hypothetical protein
MTSEPWPSFPDELAERLALDQDGFVALLNTMADAIGERDYEPALFEHALGYPWPRPDESFVLNDGAVEPWDPAHTEGRHALLAIGSNAAPERLTLKLAHFEAPEDRFVPVQTGRLKDFDVGPAPVVTGYGSMPASLFPSPGTEVALAIVWVNDTQLTQLTWSELGYWLGRLSDVTFDGETLTLYAYIHRLGTFAPDGEPVAFTAVPADGRTAPALSQHECLERAAAILGVPTAEALVEQTFRDIRVLRDRMAKLRERALVTWTRAPGSPADPATGR